MVLDALLWLKPPPTTFGTTTPFETVICTADHGATLVPGAGLWAPTRPALTFSTNFVVTDPGCRSAARMAPAAPVAFVVAHGAQSGRVRPGDGRERYTSILTVLMLALTSVTSPSLA